MNPQKPAHLLARLRSFSWLLAGAWTACIAGSLLWNLRQQEDHSLQMARQTAAITFENDVLYRRWVAQQGGVYVRVSPAVPPNPYLLVPDRDVTTTNGLALTLVNPAYLARLVNTLAGASGGSRGHLTSLMPLRPENMPDTWEIVALQAFEQGEPEVSSIEPMADGEYLRLMRPFITEPGCLKCHADQGYKTGDIRGGISVSVPMAPLRAIEAPMTAGLQQAHAGLWLIGLAGLGLFRRSLGKEMRARARAEQELRASEQRFRGLVEQTVDGIFVADAQGRFTDVNTAGAEMLGYTPEEICQLSIADVVAPEEVGRIPEAVAKFADGAVVRSEWQFRRQDGSVFPVEVVGRQLPDGRLQAIVRDITERKAAEAQLQQALTNAEAGNRMLAALMDNMPEGITICDADGNLRMVSRHGQDLLGGPHIGKHLEAVVKDWTVYRPDGQTVLPLEELPLVRALAGEVVQDVELVQINADGRKLPLLCNAAPIHGAQGQTTGAVVAWRDIIERKAAEEALRESEHRFRQVAESLPQLVWTCVAEGPCDYLSPQWVRYTGKREAEQLGYGWLEQLHPDDRERAVAQWQATAASGEHFEIEFRIRRHDGDYRWFRTLAVPLRDEAGRVVKWFGSNTDIDDLKQAEQAVRASEEKYRNLFENMAEEVHFWQLVRDAAGHIQTWRLVDANPPTLKSWGRQSVEEIRGQTTDDIFGPGATEHYRPVVEKIMTEGVPHTFEDYFPNLDKYFRFTSVPLGEFFITTGADITAIKKAQAALRRSEARWNAAIESFAEGAIIATEDEHVIYWNPAAREMHGFTRPDEGLEPLEKTPGTFELWTPDGRHKLELDEWPMRRIKRGETVRNLELRIRRTDQGWEKVFTYSGAMVETAGGERLIFLSCSDLTELRQTEQALRDSDMRFRLALRNAPVSVAAQDRDLRYIWAYNQRTARPDQIIGHFDHEIFTPEEAAHLTALKRRVLDEGIELREQRWLDRPNDRMFLDLCWEPIRDAAGRVAGVASATVDLTPIKQAEEAVRQSEARLSALYATMSEGLASHELVYADGQPVDYRLTDVNPAFERITGFARATAVDRAASELYGTGRAPYLDVYAPVAAGGPPETFETYFAPMAKHFAISVFSPGPGQFATVFSDITERKQAEERLKASLHEKEVMLKEIHHRVKNNLQIISSLVSLQADSLADPALGELFQDVRDRVRTMALVHEKLYQSDNLAQVDFAEYARSLLAYLWRTHGPAATRVRLALDLQPVLLSITLAVPCGLLLNELATNALKHAFRGRAEGEVTVALRQAPAGGVCLTVRDNGVGLPAGLDWQRSSSLGLRLVQMLTAQVQGAAQARPRDGGGTEFEITFAPGGEQ